MSGTGDRRLEGGSRLRLARAADNVVIISIILLFLAASAWGWGLPFYFYTVLRFAVCVSAIHLALWAWRRDTRVWTLIMSGIAVLFNPVVPIHLTRIVWRALDVVTAAVLCFFAFEIWMNEKE